MNFDLTQKRKFGFNESRLSGYWSLVVNGLFKLVELSFCVLLHLFPLQKVICFQRWSWNVEATAFLDRIYLLLVLPQLFKIVALLKHLELLLLHLDILNLHFVLLDQKNRVGIVALFIYYVHEGFLVPDRVVVNVKAGGVFRNQADFLVC